VFSDYLVSVQWSQVDQLYFCICQDISAQKHLDRLKQDFVSMVSHDVRTPLASITIFLEMIDDGALGELSLKGEDTVKSVIAGSKELTQLIKDLQDIERLQAGRAERGQKQIALEQLQAELTEAVTDFQRRRGTSVQFNFSPGCTVKADRDQLLQALTTIVLAALERTSPGDSVSCTAIADDSGVQVRISWRQDILMPRLTDSDFATYHPHKAGGSISGLSKLGLALARTIIERCDGSLQLHQEQDIYTCLILLPDSRSNNTPIAAFMADLQRMSP